METNKVIYDGDVLIDLTEDTVSADKLVQGYTAHDKSGAVIMGALIDPNAYIEDIENHIADTSNPHNVTLAQISGLQSALDNKQPVGDYATKAEAQGYANAKDSMIATAKQAGDDAQADVDALAEKVGPVAVGKTIVGMIAEAQTEATYDDTTIKGRVATIEGDYLKNADKTELTGLINTEKSRMDAFMNAADVGEAAVDTLKEIQAYITTDGEAAAEMTSNIAANTSAIATEASRATNAEGALSGRISTLEGVTHTHSNKSLLDTYTQTEANLADAVSKKHNHSNKTVLDDITSTKVSNWDAAEQNAKNYADGLAGNYDPVGAASGVKSEVIGAASDAAGADTIKGANKAASAAQTTANSALTKANAAVVANANITGATHTKITYDSKGLVTGGSDLEATDIPTLAISKISGLQTALDGKQPSGDYATKVQAQGYANAKDAAILAAQSAADAAQGDVDALEVKIGAVANGKTVVGMIVDAQTAATYDDTAIAGRVSTLESEQHTHGNKSLLDTYTQTNDNIADAVSKKHSHSNKSVLDNITTAKVSAWDNSEQNAKNYADQKVASLDKSDTAVAGKYVSAVSEVDGIINITREDLPDYSNTYDAKGAAALAEQSAKSYADSVLGTIETVQGPPGAPGVYYGTTAPTDASHPIWINPSGTGFVINGDEVAY